MEITLTLTLKTHSYATGVYDNNGVASPHNSVDPVSFQKYSVTGIEQGLE